MLKVEEEAIYPKKNKSFINNLLISYCLNKNY